MGMKARGAVLPELSTEVVFGASEASAMALGGTELDVVALHDPKEVRFLGFQNLYDAWSSTSGATYFCGWRQDPLFSYRDGSWALIDLEGPALSQHARIIRVVGIAGAEPNADELFCLAEPYAGGKNRGTTLLRRRSGRWSEISMPVGRAWELAAGSGNEVIISIGGESPSVLRVRGNEVQVITPPASAIGHHAVSICTTSKGPLLACFSAQGDGPAEPYLLRDNAWHPVPCDVVLKGWAIGYIDSVCWNGATFLATDGGIVRLGADDRLTLDTPFQATRLFPIGDALVCLGYAKGVRAHRIHRGENWLPLVIPKPGTTFGGRGKSALLPDRGKVARRRIRMPRMPAMQPPAAAPSADDYCQRWLEARVFQGRSEPLASPLRVAADVCSHYGSDIAPSLRHYLDLYGKSSKVSTFGELSIWSPSDFAPPSPQPRATELGAFVFRQLPSIVATLTGTLYLGADHGGGVYFVDVAAMRSEVFIYAPGLGDLAFLADSLDSFMFLNDLAQQWHDYGRAHDVDFEDLQNGDVDTSVSEIQEITRGLSSLVDRVDLDENSEAGSEFHEQLPALTGVRPTAKSDSPVQSLYQRAHWLIMLLGEVYVELPSASAPDFESDLADPELGDLAATKVYWLWHLFLFDDHRLADFARGLQDDPSALVRGVAAMMSEPFSASDETGAWLVSLRDQMRAASS